LAGLIGGVIARSQKDASPPSAARKRFLDAARKEFAAKGYAGASIRSITRSLKMRESSFYAHFASKQEAYDELFREAGPHVMASLAATVNPARPMAEELTRLANMAMKAWTSANARASTSILLREVFGEAGHKRKQLLEGVSDALDALEKSFQRWQLQRSIPEELDARTLAYQFVAPLITTRLLFYAEGTSSIEQKTGRELITKHVQNFLELLSK
jgi:AcrR family transcriptional regulator